MNKLLLLLLVVIFISGCIEIEGGKKDSPDEEKINVTFDLDEKETEEEPEPVSGDGKADLEITHIYWSTLFPDLNEEDELNVRVINNGNVSVNGFSYKITLFKEDVWKEETFDYDETLGPGNKARFSQVYSFDEAGKYKAEVYLDWDNSIKESEELNNYKQTPTITVSEEQASDTTEESDEEINITLGANKCLDSDDGINYFEKGRCVDDGPFELGMDDYCKDKFTLVELYCTNKTLRCRFAEPYECYCKSGACV